MGISKSRMREYYNTYNKIGCRTLDEVYTTYSQNKRSAWNCIRERMVKQGGSGLSVISHGGSGLSVISHGGSGLSVISHGGSWSFTTGYTYNDEQGREHFVVDTRDNVQDVLVSDL